MALPNDPIMLLSMVNLKLRDFYPTLDALCDDLDEDKTALCAKLAAAGSTAPPVCRFWRCPHGAAAFTTGRTMGCPMRWLPC